MEKRTLPDGSILCISSKGLMQMVDFKNGTALHVCRGTIVGELGDAVIADGDRILAAHGRCIFFVDCLDSSLITTEFREKITDWYKKLTRNKQVSSGHMLLKSKLVEMAVNIANLALGNSQLRAYAKISEWEAAGRREVPGFVRRPLVVPDDLKASLGKI